MGGAGAHTVYIQFGSFRSKIYTETYQTQACFSRNVCVCALFGLYIFFLRFTFFIFKSHNISFRYIFSIINWQNDKNEINENKMYTLFYLRNGGGGGGR